MKILVAQEQGSVPVTVLQISGDLDANTHSDLQDKASELIAAGAGNILLDLSGVSFMGSAGFRAIHAITNMLNEDQSEHTIQSKHVKLLNPSDEVLKIIKTLGFDAYLDIYSNLKEAVDAF
ncbi:MAG: STAS domain-containing protein [Gammaproteobacteria bacterium]